METYEVLADVSRTIISILREKMVPEPIAKPDLIGLCAPSDSGNILLGLYLYNIEEKKNLGSQRVVNVRPGVQRDPSTPLLLHYMLTVYTKAEAVNKALDEQRLLGRAVQVLNDTSKIKNEQLKGSLQQSNSSLDVATLHLSMDEKAKLWSLFNQTYQLASYYTVGPVYLESDNVRDTTAVTDFQVDLERRIR